MQKMKEIRYTQSDEFINLACIKAYDGNMCIGKAILSREKNEAELSDIIVYQPKIKIVSFLPIYRKLNYRRKGIGSKLLEKTIQLCIDHKIDIIRGKAMGDYEIILPWYKKHGFSINKSNELYLELNA